MRETAVGAVTGGLSSAAFYGVGKGIEKLWESVWNIGRDSGNLYDIAINVAMKNAGPSTPEEFKVFGHGSSKG